MKQLTLFESDVVYLVLWKEFHHNGHDTLTGRNLGYNEEIIDTHTTRGGFLSYDEAMDFVDHIKRKRTYCNWFKIFPKNEHTAK